jgi:hypothetical protein
MLRPFNSLVSYFLFSFPVVHLLQNVVAVMVLYFIRLKNLLNTSMLILSLLKLSDIHNLKVPVHRNVSVVADLQRIFCIQFVGIFIIHVHTKFYISIYVR